jgi:flagellar motor switch protein FliN
MSKTCETTETGALSYLSKEAAACWQMALEGAFGSAGFRVETPANSAATDDSIWFSCDFKPEHFGSIGFGLDRASALALGYRLLSAKGRPSNHDHHALHATTHLMGQFAALLAASVAARLKTAVTSEDCLEGRERPASPESFEVPFPEAYGENLVLTVCPSPELLSALINPSAPAENNALVAGSQTAPRNLDLLLDLEMPVSVSFGSTRLALKDVAKLTSGSVIELNRAVSEPVEIIVNNCAIARGEVVVANGNFAVRVKQVLSKQDRLRSLS